MRTFYAIAMSGLLMASGAGSAVAQGPGGASLVGRTTPAPGCPAVGVHIIREGNQLSGVVFFLDGSGVSRVNGTVNGNSFQWHDTPTTGTGPTGDVTGTVSQQGVFQSAKSGTSCTFDKLLPMLNEYSNG